MGSFIKKLREKRSRSTRSVAKYVQRLNNLIDDIVLTLQKCKDIIDFHSALAPTVELGAH